MLCLPFGAKTVSALPRKCLVENFPLITKISFTSAQDLVLDRILFSKQMRHFGPWVGGGGNNCSTNLQPSCPRGAGSWEPVEVSGGGGGLFGRSGVRLHRALDSIALSNCLSL